MAGKAPLRRKEKSHNARPYDRPNQSILGKVASTVRKLLQPSWLYSVPNWIKTEEIDGNCQTVVAEEDDFTENEDEPRSVTSISSLHPRLTMGMASKRPRLEDNMNSVETSHPAPYWMGPSTSQARSGETEETEMTSVIPNCDIGKKDTHIIVNGDDHSENSDNSASTSGCSSLISSQDKPHRSSGLKLSESALNHLRGELKNKTSFKSTRPDVSLSSEMFVGTPSNLNLSRPSLWSCGTQTPLKSSPQRPSPNNRPSFNLSSFGGSPLIKTPGLKIASPFYEGNTTFGGASAYRKKSIAPYQINSAKSLRNQLKVKESTSDEGFDCMSSAARRILHTLERMSTPITDAKRIPSVNQLPLDNPLTISPPSHRLKSYLSISRRTPTSSNKGPPIVNLNAVSKVPLLKNRNSRITRHSMMEIPIKEGPSTPLPQECVTAVSENSSTSKSGGGKMRTKVSQPLRPSKTKEVEEPPIPEYELPNVPLPIASLPVFNLVEKSPEVSTNVSKKKVEPVTVDNLQFTFSEPKYYHLPTHPPVPKTTKTSGVFTFREPVDIGDKLLKSTDVVKKDDNNKAKDVILTGSVDDVLKSMRENSAEESKQSAKNGEGRSTNKMQSTQFSSGFGDKFKPKPGSWTCSSCMLQNDKSNVKCIACETPQPMAKTSSPPQVSMSLGGDNFKFQLEPSNWKCSSCQLKNESSITKCIACETPKPEKSVNSAAGFSGFGNKFKPQADSWECSTCMVRNSASANKCVACETSKPGVTDVAKSSGFGDKFKLQAGTWECSACMVRNNASASKCVACETPKPDVTNEAKSFAGFGDKFKLQAGTWECSTCMVRNNASESKCVACETKKPEVTNEAKSFAGFGDKFKLQAGTWECSTCMVRNNTSASKCVACETPKPGITNEAKSFGQSSSENKESGFKKTTTFSASTPFSQNTEGTWKCDTCLVRNTFDNNKCIACETLKPSKRKASGDDKNNSFKFGVKTQKTDSPFTFGSSSVSTSVPNPVSTGFKFGVPAEKSTVADGTLTNTGFKFGVPSEKPATSEVTITSPLFKFGVPPQSENSGSTVKPAVMFGSVELAKASNSDGDLIKTLVSSSDSNEPEKDSNKSSKEVNSGAPVSTSEIFKSIPLSTATSNSFFGVKSPVTTAVITEPTETIGSGNFNFLASTATPKSTAPSGFQFKPPSTEKSGDSASVQAKEGFNVPVPSVTPTGSSGSIAFSQKDTVYSTTSAQSPILTSVNNTSVSEVTSVTSSVTKTIPSFQFGTSASSAATTSAPFSINSSTGMFGLFNNSGSKSPAQGMPFKIGEGSEGAKATGSGSAPQTTITTTSSGMLPFSFSAPNPFSTVTSTVPVSQIEQKSSEDISRTEAANKRPSFMAPTLLPASSAASSAPFAFGNTTAPAVSTSSFAFVSSAPAASMSVGTSQPKNAGIFTFNSGAPSSVNEPKPGFGFNKLSNEEKQPAFPAQSTPSFTGSAVNSSAISTPFKFGTPQQQQQQQQQQPSVGGFVFGGAKPDGGPVEKPFSFGAGPAKPNFSAFQPSQPTTTATPAMPSFNFGNNLTSAMGMSAFNSTGNTAFTFGAKTTPNAPAQNTLNPVAAPTNPPSLFGAPSGQPIFGGSTPTPSFGSSATPGFSNLPAPKPEPAGGFNFGAAAAANTAPSQPMFTFGASAEKKQAVGSSQSTGFNCNIPSQPPQADSSSSFSTNFNISTPPSFNFGATTAPANQPFQFAAVGDKSSYMQPAAPRKIRRAVRRGLRKEQ